MAGKQFNIRDMSGQVFINKFKKPGESSPDFRGQFKLAGELWDIAMWEKPTSSGETYFSIGITVPKEKPKKEGGDGQRQGYTPRNERAQRPRPSGDRQRVQEKPEDDFEDDIPFN